jgi:integrase
LNLDRGPRAAATRRGDADLVQSGCNIKTAALPKIKWHHLRHFAASCWIEQKLQPKTVQTFIGHATLAMTMDLYGHLFKSDDHQRAMDEIANELMR